MMVKQTTTLPVEAFPDLDLHDGDRMFASCNHGQVEVIVLRREPTEEPKPISQFIREWKGAFSLPEVDEQADPRLADLIRKHVR